MNAKIIMAAALIVFSEATAIAQTMKVILTNGSTTEYKTSEVERVEFTEANSVVDDDGHEYVDLGLPSGTLWATMNVGANSPEEYGNYYAWGETKAYGEEDTSNIRNYSFCGTYTKTFYNWNTYKYSRGSTYLGPYTKYNTIRYYGTVDDKTTLDLADDAAYVNWGDNWRMPTYAEWTELCTSCTCTWTTQNGKNGYKVTSKKDTSKSIFLPAAGYRDDSSFSYDGSDGCYWSSSLYTDFTFCAWYLNFYSGNVYPDYNYSRCCGFSVRPVRRLSASAQTMKVILTNGSTTEYKTSEVERVEFTEANSVVDDDGHEYVDLGLPSGTLWATMNVGASSPEEYGNYYAWGETKAYGEEDISNIRNYSFCGTYTKISYCWNTYKWFSGTSEKTLTKYNTDSDYGTVDNKTTLDLADDAAYVNWGENWRMPTHAEMQELYNNCTWTWTTQNGKNGYKVTSKKDTSKSIFLPAAGYRNDSSLHLAGSSGDYWSSSLYTDYPGDAWDVDFYSGFIYPDGSRYRCYGFSVRPVRRQ